MDKNTFFRLATLSICSSLDSEIALHRCYQFLSQHLPLDAIYMNIQDSTARTITYIAKADKTGGKTLDQSIQLPGNTYAFLNDEPEHFTISNRPGDRKIEDLKRDACGHHDASIMTLLLWAGELHLGAIDLVVKGWDQYTEEHAQQLLLLKEPFSIAMSNTLRHLELTKIKDRLADDNRYLSQELMHQAGREIVGADNGLRHVMELVEQVAPLNSTVLIGGETGVGKEIIANAIHNMSPRRKEPFIKINCGAIPETLIDSELFGHEKGAFTGATMLKRGRFERANKGTIFLDEIGELNLEAQVRLLRVLQNREIERVGGTKSQAVDIRVICATHQNLEELIKQGKFRQDLWFRINTFPILIPPLRHRREDIPELVHYFLNRKSREMGIKSHVTLTPAALERLTSYDWPGNVRELDNIIERELIKSKTDTLMFNDFYQCECQRRDKEDIKATEKLATLDEVNTRYIQKILKLTKGKIHGPDGAARILGINPYTLSRRMDKLGILHGRKYVETSSS
jgi:transcriptional regulator with GAF, ATPase, and Fis domain